MNIMQSVHNTQRLKKAYCTECRSISVTWGVSGGSRPPTQYFELNYSLIIMVQYIL
jgi:hypothetical protein